MANMEPKYLSAKELRETGILQEVNRRLLHPMGIVMELMVDKNEDGSLKWEEPSTVRFRDLREDPEGVCFAEFDEEDVKKYLKFDRLFEDKSISRYEQLGYIVQPMVGPA